MTHIGVMNEFLRLLTESGHVAVPAFGFDHASDRGGAVEGDFMLEMDRRARLEFPGEAPTLSPPAARWAVGAFYTACQLLVCRDVPAETVAAALKTVCPAARSPEVHYSVDLVLRYLPDLLGFARRLATGDSLVEALVRIASEWPLSSVGVPGLKPADLAEIDTLVAHRGLRQLYADRVIQHDDASRLEHPAIKAAVLASLGQHASTLHPNFAALSDATTSALLSASHDL